jgi:hypothetical protein
MLDRLTPTGAIRLAAVTLERFLAAA